MRTQRNVQATGGAFLATMLLMSSSAMANENSTAELTRNLRAVESLSALGEQLKGLVLAEFGFSADDIRYWSDAVDDAFDPALLEADFTEALDERLPEAIAEAALTFDQSPLGQRAYELVAKSHPLEEEAAIAGGRDYLENAPEDGLALVTGIYESQFGSARANLTMDIYYRAMAIAAEPVIGEAGAEEWVASAQYLRDVYVENYFSVTAGIFGALENDELTELAAALDTPEMIAYGELSTEVMGETMHAAIDRLEVTYADVRAGN
ncbi:hypothetical protein [Devosia sp. SD17-2]|uniref:hypothetical protein n=1 Tax=Devosia sp. SD17-2 TaxID=2976459 RepID=UPI0023D8688F|nr:hypothetical protein [Devosia sp. SD17-2]WEJ34101.1 hypothetical protein NYQ88_04665 [Devosia sp. SD17-2]